MSKNLDKILDKSRVLQSFMKADSKRAADIATEIIYKYRNDRAVDVIVACYLVLMDIFSHLDGDM